jgi:hypothetical protein
VGHKLHRVLPCDLQESEIEAVGWIPLGEYAQQEAFREVPLHIKISER